MYLSSALVHQPLLDSSRPAPSSGRPSFQYLQLEGGENPVQTPCSGPGLGRLREGNGGKQKHQSCSFPPDEGESDHIQEFLLLLSKGWEKEGWLDVREGKPCSSLPFCKSHSSFRRALSFAPRPWSFLLSLCALVQECARELSGCGWLYFHWPVPCQWAHVLERVEGYLEKPFTLPSHPASCEGDGVQ